MNYCGVDLETASELDIADVGAHQYFQHPSTHILCLAYGSLKEQKIWRPGQPFPPELRHAAAKGWTFVAHNAQFDGTGWKYLLPEEPFPQRWLCTATRTSANGLPRGLDEACHALGLPGKDPEGQKALKVMMKPDRKTGLFIDTPELRKDVEHYCGIDLVRMWQILNATKPLSKDEQAFFDLDWEINARGFAVDAGIVDKILGRLEQAYGELNLRVFDVTGGELGNIASNKQVSKWLSDNGVELPNLQAQTINDALAGRFTPIEDATVREVLRLRKLSGAKAASKFAAFKQRGMLEDGLLIMRDTFICNGAHTGRHTSKGMQNLKREMLSEQDVDILVNHSPEDARLLIGEPLELAGMAVRPTIRARPGKVLLIGDFAQIELRTSFWLSGERDGLQLLRDKQDLYKRVAAEIYGIPIEQVTKEQRQLGKQCFAADTQVLTNNGIKPIAKITDIDLLWDGQEWVSHQGVVQNGVKPVVNVDGINLTEDHQIKVTNKWLPASELIRDENTLQSALVTGSESLRSLALNLGQPEVFYRSLCNVAAQVSHTAYLTTTFAKGEVLVAIHALNKLLDTGLKNITGMQTSCPMMRTEFACSTGYPLALIDVETQRAQTISTMERGALTSFGRVAENFCAIASHCRVGTIQGLSWIAEMLIKDMNPATYVSYQKAKTWLTDEKFQQCRAELLNSKTKTDDCVPVFDIMNAGPRHRFTVVTKSGALVVHNCVLGCGYGIGAVTFQATCLKYGMHVPLDVCERAVQIFRNTYYPVKAFWYKLEGAICEAIRGRPQQLGPLKFAADANILAIQLPSGRKLRYQRPSLDRNEKIRYWTQDQKTHQWVQDTAWGGMIYGHVVQATANCIQREAMKRLRVEQYDIVLHAYDEVVSEGDEDQLPHYSRVMSLQDETPAWMAGMFVTVDANATRTYRK